MSRTYRRKNATHEAWRYDYEWEWNGNSIYKRFLKGDELKRARAEFHADSNPGTWNAPKWFRQRFNQQYRVKNKEILARALRECDDEPMFIPNKHMANWEWW